MNLIKELKHVIDQKKLYEDFIETYYKKEYEEWVIEDEFFSPFISDIFYTYDLMSRMKNQNFADFCYKHFLPSTISNSLFKIFLGIDKRKPEILFFLKSLKDFKEDMNECIHIIILSIHNQDKDVQELVKALYKKIDVEYINPYENLQQKYLNLKNKYDNLISEKR